MDFALAVLVALIPTLGAVWLGRRGTKKELASIEIKVDGRLEAALQRIDHLEREKSDATGEPAPPMVSGLGVPVPSPVVPPSSPSPGPKL